MAPSTLTADCLQTNLRLLKQYVDEPPAFDGKSASALLRRKAAKKSSEDSSSDSDSSSSESSENHTKQKKRRKKKRRTLDDEELQARREKRRLVDLEKQAKIKSEARILDSDDDEHDEAFFERERQLRERMAQKAMAGELRSQGTRKVSRKKRKSVDKADSDVILLEVEPSSDFAMNNEEILASITTRFSPTSQRSASIGLSRDESDDDIEVVKGSKKRRILTDSDEENSLSL